MYKFAVLVALAACMAVASAGYYGYDNGLGNGGYSLYNGGVTYGIGSYGGHGDHGYAGYRGYPLGGGYGYGGFGYYG